MKRMEQMANRNCSRNSKNMCCEHLLQSVKDNIKYPLRNKKDMKYMKNEELFLEIKVSESKLRVNVTFFFYLEQVTKYTGKVILLRRIYRIFTENFVKN